MSLSVLGDGKQNKGGDCSSRAQCQANRKAVVLLDWKLAAGDDLPLLIHARIRGTGGDEEGSEDADDKYRHR